MALDPKLLEILACPEDKGPLLYFEDESSLYNPRLKRRYAVRDDIPIMLIDEAETVDDAEHARLVAKAEADGIQPDVRGVSAARWPSTRSAFGEALCAMPEQLAAAHEARGQGRPRRRCPTADDFDHIVTLGMGGSGIAGDVLQAVGTATLPVPVTVLKHYRTPAFVGAAHARVRAVVLGRHRGDARDGARRARRRRAARRASRSGGELARARRGAGLAARRRAPTTSRCRGSRSARSSRRCSSCCSAWACCPRRTPALAARRSSSSRAGATSAGPTSTAPRNPARELARKIGRTIPIIYGGGGLGGVAAMRWKRRSTRTPRRPRSGTCTPSSTTTRSAAGASTATSPARCSRSSSCATGSSTRGSSGARSRPAS